MGEWWFLVNKKAPQLRCHLQQLRRLSIQQAALGLSKFSLQSSLFQSGFIGIFFIKDLFFLLIFTSFIRYPNLCSIVTYGIFLLQSFINYERAERAGALPFRSFIFVYEIFFCDDVYAGFAKRPGSHALSGYEPPGKAAVIDLSGAAGRTFRFEYSRHNAVLFRSSSGENRSGLKGFGYISAVTCEDSAAGYLGRRPGCFESACALGTERNRQSFFYQTDDFGNRSRLPVIAARNPCQTGGNEDLRFGGFVRRV